MADDPFSLPTGSTGAGRINAPAGADRFQPAMETINRQPARPSWNPVEEARRQAEAKAAAAGPVATATRPVKSTASARVSPATSTEGDNSRGRHHTLLPRLMVVFGLVLGVLCAVISEILQETDHAVVLDDEVQFGSFGRLVYIAVVGGAIGLYLAGWVWWTAAAAANARMKTRRASSPSFPILSIFTLAAFIVVGVRWGDRLSPNMDLVLVAGLVISSLAVGIGIPFSFRRSAAMMSAPTLYWTRMIVLPLISLAIILAALLATLVSGNAIFALPAGLLNFFIGVWFMINIVQAMASFDRATKVPNRDLHDTALPEFLRR